MPLFLKSCSVIETKMVLSNHYFIIYFVKFFIFIITLLNIIHAQIALPSFHGAQKPHSTASSSDIDVLITLDESSYDGGTNGENHPISWCKEFDGGRAFYTALGHTTESFEEELFLAHLLGGIKWSMGE